MKMAPTTLLKTENSIPDGFGFNTYSNIKKKIEPMLLDSLDETYQFRISTGNPLMDKCLRDNRIQIENQGCLQAIGIRFHQELVDRFYTHLDESLMQSGVVQAYYPLIESRVHFLDAHQEQFSWPMLHILKGIPEESDILEDHAKRLLEEDVKRYFLEKDFCGYHKPLIEVMFSSKIDPLIVHKESYQMTGRQIKAALRFFIPMSYVDSRDREPAIDED